MQRKQASTPYVITKGQNYSSGIPQNRPKTEKKSRKIINQDQADSSQSEFASTSFSQSPKFNTLTRDNYTSNKFLSNTPKSQSPFQNSDLNNFGIEKQSTSHKFHSNRYSASSGNTQDDLDPAEFLQNQNSALRDSIRKKDDELLQLNQKLRKAVHRINSHKNRKEIAERELELCKEEISQLQNCTEEKDKIIYQLYSDLKSLKELKGITNRYKQMETAFGGHIKGMQDKLRLTQEELKNKINENNSLRIRIKEYESIHDLNNESKNDDFDDHTEEFLNEIENLKKQNALLLNQNQELSNQNINFKKQIFSLQESQISSSPKNSKLQEELKARDEKIKQLQIQKNKCEIENQKLLQKLQSFNEVSQMNNSLTYQLNELQAENNRMKENLENRNSTTFASDTLLHEIRALQKENQQLKQAQSLSNINENNSSNVNESTQNEDDISLLNSMTNDSLVKEVLKLRSQNEALKKEIDKINTQSMISNIDNTDSVIIQSRLMSNLIQQSDDLFDVNNDANKSSNDRSPEFYFDNQINVNTNDDENDSNSSYSTFDEDSILRSIKKQQKIDGQFSNHDQVPKKHVNDENHRNNYSNIPSYIEDESIIGIIQENPDLKVIAAKFAHKSPEKKDGKDSQMITEIKEEIEEEKVVDNDIILEEDYQNNDLSEKEEESEKDLIDVQNQNEEESNNDIIDIEEQFKNEYSFNNILNLNEQNEEEEEEESMHDIADINDQAKKEYSHNNAISFGEQKEEESILEMFGTDEQTKKENVFKTNDSENFDNQDEEESINYDDIMKIEDSNEEESINDNILNYNQQEEEESINDDDVEQIKARNDDNNNEVLYEPKKVQNNENDLIQNASEDLLRSDSNDDINNEKTKLEEEEEEAIEELILRASTPTSSGYQSKKNPYINESPKSQDEDFFLKQLNMNSNEGENVSEKEIHLDLNNEGNDFDENDEYSNSNKNFDHSESDQLKEQNDEFQEDLSNLMDFQNNGLKDVQQESNGLHQPDDNNQLNTNSIHQNEDSQNQSINSKTKSPKNSIRSLISVDEEDIINDDMDSLGMLKEKTEQMRSVINTIRNASSASSATDDEKGSLTGNNNSDDDKKSSSYSPSLFEYRTTKRENAELKEIISKFGISSPGSNKNENYDDKNGYSNTQLIDKVLQLEATNSELVQRIEELSQNESQIVDRYEEENRGLRTRINHLESQLDEAVAAEAEAREIAIAAASAAEISHSTANSSRSFNNSNIDEDNEISTNLNLDLSPQFISGLSPSQREEIQNVFEGFKSQISELNQSLSDIQKENSILETKMNEQISNELELIQESEKLKAENQILRDQYFAIQNSYSNHDIDENDNGINISKYKIEEEEEEESGI